jgi:hypothetical protein
MSVRTASSACSRDGRDGMAALRIDFPERLTPGRG